MTYLGDILLFILILIPLVDMFVGWSRYDKASGKCRKCHQESKDCVCYDAHKRLSQKLRK